MLSVICVSAVNIQKEAFRNESSSPPVPTAGHFSVLIQEEGTSTGHTASRQSVCAWWVIGRKEGSLSIVVWHSSAPALSSPRAHKWEQYFISAPYKPAVVTAETLSVAYQSEGWLMLPCCSGAWPSGHWLQTQANCVPWHMIWVMSTHQKHWESWNGRNLSVSLPSFCTQQDHIWND